VARRVDSAIGLHIVQRGPEIEIRWDPDNPFVRTCVRGSLIIRETAESHIDLDAARVQSGVYSYKPVRNFLTLALTIYHADGSYTDETTTFTRAPEPEASPLQRPSNVPALTRAKQPSTNPPLPRAESNPPAPRSNPAAQPVAPPVTNTSSPDAQATQRSVETPQPSSSEHAATLPEPARAPVAADPPAVNAAAVPVVPQPPAPPSPSPEQSIANTFVGPHIVHQAVPAIPLGIAASIRGAVQVEVRVTIDASGKVSGARVVASTGGAASLLTIEALKAAQLCRFAAAEENGHPVASSMVVTFRFARKSN
jgi:TonB family protein